MAFEFKLLKSNKVVQFGDLIIQATYIKVDKYN